MISVAALEQAAREATGGPWKWRRIDGSLRGKDGNAIFYPSPRSRDTIRSLVNHDADAVYLALASPSTLLALVEATRAAERVACLPLPMSSDERVEWLTALEQLRAALGRFSFTDGGEA